MRGNQEEGEDVSSRPSCAPCARCAPGSAPSTRAAWLSRSRATAPSTALAARRCPPAGELDELPSTGGLADVVESRTDLRDLLADLARLPDDQRAALVLAELGDLSHDRIAEVLGVRANA